MKSQVCIIKTFLLLTTCFVFWLFYLHVEDTFCTRTLDSLVSPSLPMESLSHDSDHVRFCIVVIRVTNIIECHMEIIERILIPIATPWGFPAELGNIPQMYLHEHYQIHGSRLIMWIFWWNHWALLSHCKNDVFNINIQNTYSVLGLWLSETYNLYHQCRLFLFL